MIQRYFQQQGLDSVMTKGVRPHANKQASITRPLDFLGNLKHIPRETDEFCKTGLYEVIYSIFVYT
jgi:hypothetical protein